MATTARTRASNISTSPIRFIAAMGQAYRASGRTRPLFDAVSFHPYPQSAKDPYTRSYAWPNAGMADLDRLKQAYWDAFHGTAQPTFEEGLRLNLDETGWQTAPPTDHAGAYTGAEVSDTTDEATQAQIYGDVIRISCATRASRTCSSTGCSTSRTSRAGSRACSGRRRDTQAVHRLGPSGRGRDRRALQRTAAGLPARRLGDRRAGDVPDQPQAGARDLVRVHDHGRRERDRDRQDRPRSLAEGLLERAAQRPLDLIRRATGSVASADGRIQARWAPVVRFPQHRLKPGWYVYAVKVSAELNPDRTSTFVSGAFRVG